MKSKITPQSSRQELEKELERIDALIADFKLHIVKSFDRMNMATLFECWSRMEQLKSRRAYVFNLIK